MSTSPDEATRLANRAAGFILIGIILIGVVIWLSIANGGLVTAAVAPIACFWAAGKAIADRRKLR